MARVTGDNTESPLVSVIMIYRNTESFIGEAIDSVLSQTYPHWELLLVDDASTDGSTALAASYAERFPGKIQLLHHPDRAHLGTGASRNAGAARASGTYLAFLDSDDVWLEGALDKAVSIFRKYPIIGFTYGAAQWWYSWTGDPVDRQRDFLDRVADQGTGPDKLVFPPQFVATMVADGGAVPCLNTVVVRRELYRDVCGCEDHFRGLFEDQVLYTKIGLHAVGFRTGDCWARYRQHARSTCAAAEREGEVEAARKAFETWRASYLSSLGIPFSVVRDYGVESPAASISEKDGRVSDLEQAKTWLEQQWVNYKTLSEEKDKAISHLKAWIEELESGKRWLEDENKRLREDSGNARGIAPLLARFVAGPRKPASHRVSPGFDPAALPRVPVSRAWGYDRGTPVDRYYIERFLSDHQNDIRGRVLEVGDSEYTRRFGRERVTQSDVLHVAEGNPQATIVADLTAAAHIPSDSFDCIILTQTLQLIYDLPASIQTLYRILRPGGTLLATAPGITRSSETEWAGSWFWSLTAYSARKLAGGVFGSEHVDVRTFGNIVAATAFLYGFARQDLTSQDLDTLDPEYAVIVGIRAVKSSGAGSGT
jgi:glycosyltransferase involved in cell wall biosynthesis/SAM-dependent methyltransferase